MNNSYQFNQQSSSDEIDLVDLLHGVWKQKALVVGCVILSGLLGVGYALLAPRVYQVSTVLTPAAINELDALNRSDIYPLSPTDALGRVAVQLDSYETRFGFFQANPTLFQPYQRPGLTPQQSFEAFNRDAMTVVRPDLKNPDGVVRLDMQYPQDVDGPTLVNGFVDYAIAQQRAQVGADMSVIVNNRLAEVKGKIEAARANYESEKAAKIARLQENDSVKRAQLQDELDALRVQMRLERTYRLEQLSEAIAIAKSIGLQKPGGPMLSGRVEGEDQGAPLYFLGVQVLEAERAALAARTSDDFTNDRIAEVGRKLRMLETNREVEVLKARNNEDVFLQNVAWLRDESTRLRGINTDMSTLKLVTVDRRAQAPLSPIKPRQTLIIVLSLVAGLILGMLVALIRHLLKGRETARTESIG